MSSRGEAEMTTSEKLDHTLKAYGRLEASNGVVRRELGRYREALEAARDALADPNTMAEDTDSPANMAFAIVNHALAPLPRTAERPDR